MKLEILTCRTYLTVQPRLGGCVLVPDICTSGAFLASCIAGQFPVMPYGILVKAACEQGSQFG